MKGKLFLIHWNRAEAEERAQRFRADGWDVRYEAEDGSKAYQAVGEFLPDVVVVSLVRLPSHGRVTSEHIRQRKATRAIPIVFVDGDREPLEKTKTAVPDAVYTTSAALDGVLAALANP